MSQYHLSFFLPKILLMPYVTYDVFITFLGTIFNIDANNYFLIRFDKFLIPHEIIGMKVKNFCQPLPPHLSLIFLNIYSIILG